MNLFYSSILNIFVSLTYIPVFSFLPFHFNFACFIQLEFKRSLKLLED